MLGLFLIASGHSLAADCPHGTDWQHFERRVRDGGIGSSEGRDLIAYWSEALEQRFIYAEFDFRVFFPLTDYGLQSIGGRNGEGYKPAGYEFLGGNRHKGHPAQDIFIRDRNQDGLDDRTGRPVEVLSIADGVVLSTFSEWTSDEAHRHIRGGNYVWVYHPALRMFSYYAHLQAIRMKSGEKIAGGAPIGTLGRTGTNAFPPRSPTHLHFMLLRATDMAPVDPYPMLVNLP